MHSCGDVRAFHYVYDPRHVPGVLGDSLLAVRTVGRDPIGVIPVRPPHAATRPITLPDAAIDETATHFEIEYHPPAATDDEPGMSWPKIVPRLVPTPRYPVCIPADGTIEDLGPNGEAGRRAGGVR